MLKRVLGILVAVGAITTTLWFPAAYALQGGSIVGHGPAIVDGMLFMGSGYNILASGGNGNVLLAFGIEEEAEVMRDE